MMPFDPDFIRVYRSKAEALTKLGRYDQALTACNKGLQKSGTSKQFKELLWARFPDIFTKWYKSPSKYVDEIKKIAPDLQEEGIGVNFPPETTLITLTRPGKENGQPPEEIGI